MGLLSQEAPHNIVILRALQLGDLLCSVPAFRALRAAYPKARISLIGLPWAEEFVRRFSDYLDDFIQFPGWPGLPEQAVQAEKIPEFLKAMQRRNFDLALQMQGNGTYTNPLMALLGAHRVAGFYLPGQFCPDEALFQVYPEGEHEIRVFLRLLKGLGIPSQGEELEFPVTASEQAAFEQFSQARGLRKDYVCLHPGARAASRRWAPEKFAAVGDALAQMGYQVVLTGSAQEAPLVQEVARAMRSPALDTAGQTSLDTLAQLIGEARLLVSNDTGVSHLAVAMKTPSVVLFTIPSPSRWRPLDEQRHRVIDNAMQATPEQVLAEAVPLLKEMREYAHDSL